MAKKSGSFVHTVTFGKQSLNISYLNGTCFPIDYDSVLGSGFSMDGTMWVCDPIEDSYTDGHVRYMGVIILTYHLDKNGLETSTTVAGVAKFKVRLNNAERKLQFMRCDFNDDIFDPGYDCPNDWLTLVSW